MNKIEITKEQYPFLLRQIPRLPDHMDLAGKLPGDENKFLCIIGSRNHTFYGKEACEKLVKGLRGYPIVIVSGLAVGIDSVSHEAALEAGLRTVAFPGSGLSSRVLYPFSRRGLAKRILEAEGALLSPFEFAQESTRWTFPVRNRLMAGMSHATLIIEARKGSGTLITAEYATQFNRDILAVPGSIFSDLSYGPHMLISRGATPVTSSRDILEALGFDVPKDEAEQALLPLSELALESLSLEEKRVIDLIRDRPLSGSDLLEGLAISPSAFNMLISQLELKGFVAESSGMYRMQNK